MKSLLHILIILSLCLNAEAQLSSKWVGSFGDTNNDYCKYIATDHSGNLIAGGEFTGYADFGVDTSTLIINSAINGGIFLAKYDTAGTLLWAKSMGSAMGGYPHTITGVQTDNNDNIYISGNVPYNSGNMNWFLKKYNSNGDSLWEIRSTSSFHEYSSCIFLDSAANIYVTGRFEGTVDFDPSGNVANQSSTGWLDIFHAKYDSSGHYIWANHFGSSIDDIAFKTVVDAAGNIYTAGERFLNSNSDFICKHNAAGILQWYKAININATGTGDHIYDMELDASGNIYIAGAFRNTTDFDPGNGNYYLTSAVSWFSDAFFAKYDAAGNFLWAHSLGGASSAVNSIDIDKAGNVWLTGSCSYGDFNPDPSVVVNAGTSTATGYIASYDTSGNFRKVYVTDNGYVRGADLIINDDGNVYWAGTFSLTSDFLIGPGTLNHISNGLEDVFFGRFERGICDSYTTSIVKYSDIDCSNPSSGAYASVSGGTTPYNYSWNTTPPTLANSFVVNTRGIYTLTTSDSNSCTSEQSVIINGPGAGSAYDLKADIHATTFRPSVPNTIWVNAFNDECQPVSGMLEIVLDPMLSYQTASPLPSQVTGNILRWNFSNLVYGSAHLSPVITVLPSITLSGGDTVYVQANVSPATGDDNPADNTKDYQFIVVNSYDPNDKSVFPQGRGPMHGILNNIPLTYTIRFQNTGTADALNVLVADTIDAGLNFQSLHIIQSSHSMRTVVLSGNVLHFIFDNINLPDSATNEPMSHGFVTYEIDQIPGLSQGTVLRNTAYIYFDFNPPIVTNTTFNTIDLTIDINSLSDPGNSMTVFPNPADDQIKIHSDGASMISAEFFTQSGSSVLAKKLKGAYDFVNTKNLSQGMYFIKVITEKGIYMKKMVVKHD